MKPYKEFQEIKKRYEAAKLIWKVIRICCSDNEKSKHSLLYLNEKYQIAACM